MFSRRIHWELEENDLTRLLARKRAAGESVCDLTGSNPTQAGLDYPGHEILKSIASEEALLYEPDPRGKRRAREAVAGYYRERGASIPAEHIFLTSSTSEAYSFLFKLLADPEDEILVPRPSYPLFDFLAALDAVKPRPYPLRYDGSWQVDFRELEASLGERCRAIVVVHPNNPTGSYVAEGDRNRLLRLAAERGLALIADEVFLDFSLEEGTRRRSFAGEERGLVFVLSGLSKLAALPQMKLSWIVLSGDRNLVEEGSERLEHIGDTYLSVGAPVQAAARSLLEIGARIRPLISRRARGNLDSLARWAGEFPAVTPLLPEGGWYAAIRLPAIRSAEEWALRFLEKDSVYVHPGNFFGFEIESVIVSSLLTPEDTFSQGIHRILSRVTHELDSRDV
jgi:aspartate/methionine/tyrosine aminotransferase